MPSESTPVLRAIVLGNDAFVAARPATPLQLIGACLRAGYDFVAPVAWGEEILAIHVARAAGKRAASPLIPAHCPFVAEALRAQAPPPGTCLTAVAPPVATARYLRLVFRGRELTVAYCGRCPGATSSDIEEHVFPDVLLARLADAGIVAAEQPHHLEAHLPPELSRYASLPGGTPEPGWLEATTGAAMREAAPATVAVLDRLGHDGVRIADLHAACGCVCASDRFAVAALEPPRATAPTAPAAAAMQGLVDLRNGPRLWRQGWDAEVPLYADVEPAPEPTAADPREREASLAVPGLADAAPEPPPATETSAHLRRLTLAVEPWIADPPLAPPPVPARRPEPPPRAERPRWPPPGSASTPHDSRVLPDRHQR